VFTLLFARIERRRGVCSTALSPGERAVASLGTPADRGQGGFGYECGFFPEEHHKYAGGSAVDCLRGSSAKLGAMQRRLARPLRWDDTRKSRSVNTLAAQRAPRAGPGGRRCMGQQSTAGQRKRGKGF